MLLSTTSFSTLTRIGVLLPVGLTIAFSAPVDLPKEGFPLGRADLAETRTVRELRPGVTYVHVERGGWGPEGPPKMTVVSAPQRDSTLLSEFRSCLEGAGYTLREHRLGRSFGEATYHMLSAGEFRSGEEARQVARQVSCPVYIANPVYFPDWDTGPWTLDIVIVDPKVYRGKVVSAWSGMGWRASPLELSRQYDAVAAINGSWFEYSLDGINGVPSGISIVQGEWHSEPYPNQTWKVYIENTEEGAKLWIGTDAPPPPEFHYADGKSVPLEGVDRMPKENELVAMRADVVRTSPPSHGYPPGVLPLQIGEDGYLGRDIFHKGGLVLMATGTKQAVLEEALAAKKPVTLDLRIPGRPGLNALYTAHPLILNGQSARWEDWGDPPNPNLMRRMARTAIGADAEGRIYLISIDGAGSYFLPEIGPIGVNMDELEDVARFLGLVDAANLDSGGSSSVMVVEGEVLGHYLDYHLFGAGDDDRRVGDAVLIVDDE